MELRHLRYFLAVAEEAHFGRAARRLKIAQPPLSRQVQALERELGFELFDRSMRRVQLTPAGAVLKERATKVLAEVEAAVEAAKRAHVGDTGRLAVGYLSSLAYTGITTVLRAYRERFPEVQLALRELGPQDQVAALKSRAIDVGFTRGPLEEPTLAWETVRREEIIVALPEGHRLSGRSRLRLAELAREPFVLFPRERGPAYFDQLTGLCRTAGFSPIVAQEAPHLDVLSMVSAGFGVALVPASVRYVPREGLVTRSLAEAPRTELVVAWRGDDKSPTLAEFLGTVRRVGLRDRPKKAKRRPR